MRQKLHTILITGGAGFIGSEFTRQAVKAYGRIVVADKVTYAGDPHRLSSVKNRIKFHKADITHKLNMGKIFRTYRPSAVVHFAAETHVDRSIHTSALPFVQTNVIGTQNLIDLSREYGVKKFIHISTDEVYGDSHRGRFKEDSPLRPNNPYSATKAAAEMLVRAAVRTHNFPGVIVRPANNYGPWQYPEKFIPVVILKILRGEKVPVYGKGLQIREWLHISDCANAILLILEKGVMGESYNIGSYFEKANIQTAKTILKLLGKDESQIQFVKDRPGHDFRYSVDCSKLIRLGWKPAMDFSVGIKQTINWYMENTTWLKTKRAQLERYWKTIYKKR